MCDRKKTTAPMINAALNRNATRFEKSMDFAPLRHTVRGALLTPLPRRPRPLPEKLNQLVLLVWTSLRKPDPAIPLSQT